MSNVVSPLYNLKLRRRSVCSLNRGQFITRLIVAVYLANRTGIDNLSLPKAKGILYTAHISMPLHTNIPYPCILEIKSAKLKFISN